MRTTRVFVIDDDHSVRRSVSRLLKAAGFRVEAFESGQAFLKRAPPWGDHCLVVDVRMPGMSALELYRALRAARRYSPMVFITAHGTEEIRRDLPGKTVLAKPLEADVLIRAIDEAALRGYSGKRTPAARK
jgi:FixJ family two-component response regulator